MFNASNPVAILVPMLVVVALTFFAFLRLGMARTAAMKDGVPIDFYRAHIGKGEPETATVSVRHYGNLFEMPVLFYAGCLTAVVLGAASVWLLTLAWAYVAGRLIQSTVHLTYNNPMHRGAGFMLGTISLFALWINLAIVIFSQM